MPIFTPIFTPDPNDDKITSCMDHIYKWINKRHPLDTRRMELFKLRFVFEENIQLAPLKFRTQSQCKIRVTRVPVGARRGNFSSKNTGRRARVGQISACIHPAIELRHTLFPHALCYKASVLNAPGKVTELIDARWISWGWMRSKGFFSEALPIRPLYY